MTSPVPRISVLIPTFNPGPELLPAVESVLAQDGVDVDVHILDDGSRSGPERRLGALIEHPRITTQRNSVNHGAAATWNALFEAATAPYVKILPQDDLLAPGCLASQLKALQSSGAVVAAGQRRLLTRRGRAVGPRLGLSGLAGKSGRRDVLEAALRIGGNPVGEPGSWLIAREAAEQVSFRQEAGYAIDLDYLLDLLKHGPLVGVPAVHTYFRVSNSAWTARLASKQVIDVVRVLTEASDVVMSGHETSRMIRRVRRRSLARQATYRFIGGRQTVDGTARS